MYVSVYLPLVLSALFGLTAPALGRRLPPEVATWLLSVGGLLAAAASTASLALLGLTIIIQNWLLADQDHWSETALLRADPVSMPIAAAAACALLVLGARFAAAGVRRLGALRDARQLAAALPAAGELAVIDLPGWHACAVPGRPGRIVVSAGLLRSLDAGERRAVLAHERAHLTHRHHLHQTAAHLAAAANPVLRRLPAAVAFSTERWADEEAAAMVRRDTVADALTRAAACGAASPAVPAVVLAAVTTQVASRVRALRAPAPRLTLWRVALLLVLLAAAAAALLDAGHDAERLLDLALYSYRIGPG